jgi:hypothetical protein
MRLQVSKPFDAALYESDDDAKFLVIRWLESRGHQMCVNPDQYGIDLLGVWRDRRYAWEVEVKHNWRGFDFPFDSVHYSVRKRKFINPDVHTYFVTLNHERTRLLAVSGKDVMEARIIQKSTIYTQDEWFMEIPIRRGIFVDLDKEGL